ncbi:MAG: phospholipase [Bacteroidaceae bacterium]|nr:phospholipase [Bacteroidaceae bacterium]
MWILIASLLVLGIVAAIAGILRNRSLEKKLANGEIKEMPSVKMVLDCGADSCELDEGKSCDLECMTPIIKKDIDYYDDEELDAYKGKPSDQYTDEETEEFRNVFYTMQEEDVPGWVKSLQQRELNIPDDLKDEILLVLREIRKNK